jgi:undecaprenyl-diphosphatase
VSLVLAALLGVVQGLTEFLPVSSSAHLILGREVFGWDAGALGLAFDVACHVGTLLAVLFYFRSDILELLRAVPRLFSREPDPAVRLARLIALGTIPTVVVGLALGDVIEQSLRTPAVAATMLALVAFALFAAEGLGPRTRSHDSLSAKEVLAIGVAQAAALVPGVSRSGATIAAAMAFGLRREGAARFTFLMGIPAILGAALREGVVLADVGFSNNEAGLFLVGMTTSAIVGYLAVKYFIRYVARHSLAVFAWYRLLLAGVVVVWLLVR